MPTYNYDFGGLSGLVKFLFKKKICPQCRVKLKRHTEKTYVGWKKTTSGPTTYYGDTYSMFITYKCESCEKVYSLKDL